MKVEISSVCDIGLKRARNQDSILVHQDDSNQFALLLVADGMGGYADGERASTAIANGMRDWIEKTSLDSTSTISEMLASAEDALLEINQEIWEQFNQDQICGSTCVLLILYQENYGILSAGDSRIYRCRGRKVEALTRDDVWENQPHIREIYTPKEIQENRNYGKLTSAMGSDQDVVLSMQTGDLVAGDRFLLCSDGVYKMCDHKFLVKQLRGCHRGELDKFRTALFDEVCRNGARDNVSLILVRCSDY